MAEAAMSNEIQEKKGSFGKILFLGINILLCLAGVAFFLLTKFGILAPTPADDAATAAAANPCQPMAAQAAPPGRATPLGQVAPTVEPIQSQEEGVFVQLKPFVVNLKGARSRRYLRVSMEMEIAGETWKAEFDKRLSQVRNRLIFLLSNKTFDDINSVEGKYALQDDITQQVNETLGRGLVRKTYFTDFIMQ